LPLLWWKLAQVAEGLAHELAPIGLHLGQSLAGTANLLLALGRKGLKTLIALEHALTLGWWFEVEPVQAIDELLLLFGRQTVESGFMPQSIFLLIGREGLMARKPFGQVLALVWTDTVGANAIGPIAGVLALKLAPGVGLSVLAPARKRRCVAACMLCQHG
jgi:hypothetical protein